MDGKLYSRRERVGTAIFLVGFVLFAAIFTGWMTLPWFYFTGALTAIGSLLANGGIHVGDDD